MENNEYKVGDKIKISQRRSAAGRDGRFRDTLSSLGLGRIGDCAEFKLDKCIWGKIERILSVITISKA